MERLFAILALAAVAAAPPLAGCRKRAAEKKAEPAGAPAAAATPLDFDALQTMFPEALGGMPRQIVVPTPEIPQASAYYQTEGNTRSGHVVYTLVSDPARTLEDWKRRYPERATIDGRTVYTRTYKLKSSPEAAQGCVLVGDRVSACVDVTPGAAADLPALFGEVPIAEIAARAAAPVKK